MHCSLSVDVSDQTTTDEKVIIVFDKVESKFDRVEHASIDQNVASDSVARVDEYYC